MVFKPETFGKYVLLKRIAVGGMAEVFRAKAFGAEGFEKQVAIKRMLPHLSSDEQFVGMFINEAKLTASLNQANIAQIYDFGCIDKMYFLSMEYVFGKDLADLIRMLRNRGLTTPVEFACHVMIEALNGLDYAHRKTDHCGNPLNLVHRDTSPHNLIISYEGEVKIVDFGIAKAKSTTVHTIGGVLKGKYSYMSPEQAHGMVLDHRTDIFSLGICFYELLTLTKMFQGSSDLSVLEKVRETKFIPPRELNDSIPDELEDLLLKALEKDPEDRWSSAAEWRDELDSFLFRSNLHYSTSWLAGFMGEIFHEQIDREAAELTEEAEVAKHMRTSARRVARMEAIRDTVLLRRQQDGSSEPAAGDDVRPPIREVFGDGEDLQGEFKPAFLDTARAAKPLGQLRAERAAAAGDLEEVDDPSLIPARRQTIREIAAEPEDDGADIDEAEVETLDERNPPPPPVDMEEEFTETDFDARDTLKNGWPLVMEESTARRSGKRFPVMLAVVLLVAALGVGGAVALWPHLSGSGSDTGGADAGLVVAGPGTGRTKPAGPDAGHPITAMVPLRPERDRAAAGSTPDAGPAGTGGDPDVASAEAGGGDPVQVAVSTGADPGPVKPPSTKKRRRYRRRRTTSCPSRGYGSIDVGVSGGWAFVHIDGSKVRATPLLNFRLKAGRHKVELRDGSDQLVRRWNVCLKNKSKVKLLHQ